MIRERIKLDLWHAGCSTGEEVFTFNIILKELGLHRRVKSYATDMSSDAIEQAKQGTYNTLRLEEYDRNYSDFNPQGSLQNYYRKEGESGIMDKALLKHVKFKTSNLISETHADQYDIIFCRNVMIYFDNGAKKLVLDKFYKNLKPGGLLIIGFFDALMPVIDKSKFEVYDLKNKIFRRIN